MGLFKSFVRGVGRLVGAAIEKVGDFVGSDKLSDLGFDIQIACAEEVASERSYDKREADIHTTDRLNEVLISFSEGYNQHAAAIERDCIRLVEKYYDKLIALVENIPEGARSAANLKALKNERKRIEKMISGSIKDPLARKMSLDDSECLKILKMDAGVEKKKAMTEFTKKVINGALDNLAENVRETLNDQTEDIQEYLNSIAEEQEKAMQALKEQFDKMVKDNELEQSAREKNCVLPLYLIDVSDCIFDILR